MKRRKASLALAAVLLFSFPVAQADNYFIEGVNLIPMTSEEVLEARDIAIVQGKVAGICQAGEGCAPQGARPIDGRGKFLIPGLTDMHAHVDGLGILANEVSDEMRQAALRTTSQQLRQYLLFGVTTIRDTGGGPANLEARAAIERGEKVGPRLFTSFVPMDGEPRLHPATTPFASADVAIDFVRQTVAAGYDYIKAYSTLQPPVFDAIMETAREEGIEVIGHLPMPVDFEHALKSGMRSVEHLSGFDVACAGPDAGIEPTMNDVYQGWAYCTPEKIQALAELTTEHEVWMVPTLIVVEGLKTEHDRYAFFDEEELYYSPPRLAVFYPYLYEIFPPRTRTGLKGSRSTRLAIVKALSDAGAPLLIGTDTIAAGLNVHQELALFVEAGLTPYQALTAGTSEPARFFKREGEFGTIVEGASADLVLLDANPLVDIANAREIHGVMVRGDWWSRDRIDNEIEALQEEYVEDRLALGGG